MGVHRERPSGPPRQGPRELWKERRNLVRRWGCPPPMPTPASVYLCWPSGTGWSELSAASVSVRFLNATGRPPRPSLPISPLRGLINAHTDTYSLTVPEARAQDHGASCQGRVGICPGPVPSSGGLWHPRSTEASPPSLCVHRVLPCERVCVQISLLTRTPVTLEWGPASALSVQLTASAGTLVPNEVPF